MPEFPDLTSLLTFSKQELKKAGIASFSIDTILLAQKIFCLSKEQIIFSSKIVPNQNQIDQFLSLLARRMAREPMSHILEKRAFFDDDFFVTSAVLDPRPDSESLIEAIREFFTDKNYKLNILELGVGSGCLILTVLKIFPNSSGIGIDISEKALEIAKKNAKSLKLENKISFIKSNWFENIVGNYQFDLIISNPPYIPTNDINNLEDEVRIYEPILALDGGKDGLDCYLEIAKNIKNFLKPDGILVLEIGQNQEKDVEKIFEKCGLKLILSKKDLSGIIRCLMFKHC